MTELKQHCKIFIKFLNFFKLNQIDSLPWKKGNEHIPLISDRTNFSYFLLSWQIILLDEISNFLKTRIGSISS